MESLGFRDLPREHRERILRARVATATPKQLQYLELDTKRRLKSGHLSQRVHDYILKEIETKSINYTERRTS